MFEGGVVLGEGGGGRTGPGHAGQGLSCVLSAPCDWDWVTMACGLPCHVHACMHRLRQVASLAVVWRLPSTPCTPCCGRQMIPTMRRLALAVDDCQVQRRAVVGIRRVKQAPHHGDRLRALPPQPPPATCQVAWEHVHCMRYKHVLRCWRTHDGRCCVAVCIVPVGPWGSRGLALPMLACKAAGCNGHTARPAAAFPGRGKGAAAD